MNLTLLVFAGGIPVDITSKIAHPICSHCTTFASMTFIQFFVRFSTAYKRCVRAHNPCVAGDVPSCLNELQLSVPCGSAFRFDLFALDSLISLHVCFSFVFCGCVPHFGIDC